MRLHLATIESPLGGLLVATDAQECLRALDFAGCEARFARLLREHYCTYELLETPAPGFLVNALRRYFEGDLAALDEVVTATGGSELQRRVWAALNDIPAGKTTRYGALARTLGYDDPRMAIEVGAALGANPIAVVVPCHRVIATDGGLKGYAGGLHRKRWLLEHEHAIPAKRDSSAPSQAGFSFPEDQASSAMQMTHRIAMGNRPVST